MEIDDTSARSITRRATRANARGGRVSRMIFPAAGDEISAYLAAVA